MGTTTGGSVNADNARGSAYAELIVGLIDARDRAAEERFDEELAAAEAAGRIDPQTARTLRWWQRESVRAVVTQAEQVVPTTLQALEIAAEELRDRTAAQREPTVLGESLDQLDPTMDSEYQHLPEDTEPDEAPLAAVSGDTPPPPADLTARRLLVAGLTPLRAP